MIAVADLVEQFAKTPPENRTAMLQNIIGRGQTNVQLHRNALLVTALRKAGLWPIGCR